jgi:ribosome-binding protein aMBF1 (putative translation factor)
VSALLPRPVSETARTVTLRKSDWYALVARLEDIEDLKAVASVLAHEDKVGKEVAWRDYLTGEELGRLLDDESPVKIWREKRGLSQRELASQAEISPSYLAEIEMGKKPGSADALCQLSRVLAIPMENLVSQSGRAERNAGSGDMTPARGRRSSARKVGTADARR